MGLELSKNSYEVLSIINNFVAIKKKIALCCPDKRNRFINISDLRLYQSFLEYYNMNYQYSAAINIYDRVTLCQKRMIPNVR